MLVAGCCLLASAADESGSNGSVAEVARLEVVQQGLASEVSSLKRYLAAAKQSEASLLQELEAARDELQRAQSSNGLQEAVEKVEAAQAEAAAHSKSAKAAQAEAAELKRSVKAAQAEAAELKKATEAFAPVLAKSEQG